MKPFQAAVSEILDVLLDQFPKKLTGQNVVLTPNLTLAVTKQLQTLHKRLRVLDPLAVPGRQIKSAVDVGAIISGIVESLDDPFTVYLPPTQNNDFKQGLAGQFQGIGAELGTKDKRIIVIAPLNGSPAQKAGVRAGDIILKVDGQSTESWNLPKAVEEIRGPKGSSVVLNILHKDEKAPRDIKITRDVITIKSVDGYVKKIKDIDIILSKHKKILEAELKDIETERQAIETKLKEMG